MVVTLWISKKARTVTETELSLGQQEEGIERFESTMLARAVVRMVIGLMETVKRLIPRPVLRDGGQAPGYERLRRRRRTESSGPRSTCFARRST